jgi:hypothetical protein
VLLRTRAEAGQRLDRGYAAGGRMSFMAVNQ